MAKFTKGTPKPANSGKKKGTPNKVTKKAHEIFVEIMDGEINNVKESLQRIRRESDYNYLNVLSKLMPYYMPKKVDITTQLEGINLIVDNSDFVDKLNE